MVNQGVPRARVKDSLLVYSCAKNSFNTNDSRAQLERPGSIMYNFRFEELDHVLFPQNR